MEPWQAFILGVIEGITEYLPISSTGHLIVAQYFMGIGTDGEAQKAAADIFAICIQGGAILAVLGLYYRRTLQMAMGLMGRDPEGLRLALLILAGFLPAAVLGLLFNDWIEAKLFSPWPIAFALFVGGVSILAVARWRRKNIPNAEGKGLMELTWRLALVIGLLQCFAMWPGTSRSLMTIVGGLLVGLTVQAAVEYSFLLGVLTLTAATVKKAVWPVQGLGIGPEFDSMFGGLHLMMAHYGTGSLLVGLLASTVSAALAVKWLVRYLQRHGLSIFGWYRIGFAMLVAALIMSGMFAA